MILPLPIEIQILTWRIPWPPHRLSSVRECVELSTPSHPSALVCQGGTSTRSCLSLQCLVIVKQPLQWDDPREQNSSPSHRCAVHMHQGHLHSPRCCKRKSKTFSEKLFMHIVQYRSLFHNTLLFHNTYKWKVSLNFGDQLLLLDFVECFLRLSLRCGPIRLTSTKGRNMPDVCHFRLLAATTVQTRGYSDINEYSTRVGNISTDIKYKIHTHTLLWTWPDMHKNACSFFDKNVTERQVSFSWYTVYMYIYVHVPIVQTKILILALKTLINPVLFFKAKCTLQVVDMYIFVRCLCLDPIMPMVT